MGHSVGGHSPTKRARRSMQSDGAGVGPLYHRRYQARTRDVELSAEELMARVTAEPNRVAPTELARLSKGSGRQEAGAGGRRVGGAHARSVGRPGAGRRHGPASFRLATPDGHFEADQIEFGPPMATAASPSPSSRGPAAAISCLASCTSAFTWPRRSSSTCGRRSWSGRWTSRGRLAGASMWRPVRQPDRPAGTAGVRSPPAGEVRAVRLCADGPSHRRRPRPRQCRRGPESGRRGPGWPAPERAGGPPGYGIRKPMTASTRVRTPKPVPPFWRYPSSSSLRAGPAMSRWAQGTSATNSRRKSPAVRAPA